MSQQADSAEDRYGPRGYDPMEDFVIMRQHTAQMFARACDTTGTDEADRPRKIAYKDRVVMLAVGMMNPAGHAPFNPGVLRSLLTHTVVDLDTGDTTTRTPGDKTLRLAIEAAKREGLIMEESSARCIVPNPAMFQKRGGSGARGCKFHKFGDTRGRQMSDDPFDYDGC